MRKILIPLILISILSLAPFTAFSETIDALIKGVDDGVKTNKQQDYKEAVMNAKLQAIERAGVEIKSITKVVNFQMKFDVVEAKAEAALLQGYRVMDMGYQTDGSYQVILSGKVQTGGNSGSSKVVSKVVDQLLNLLTDKSSSATERIKLPDHRNHCDDFC